MNRRTMLASLVSLCIPLRIEKPAKPGVLAVVRNQPTFGADEATHPGFVGAKNAGEYWEVTYEYKNMLAIPTS